MLSYIAHRLIYMVVIMVVISIVSFIIIQLPPGDFLTHYVQSLRQRGLTVEEGQIRALTKQYGLNLPIYLQYFKWMGNLFHGNMGMSMQWNKPVSELIASRLFLTLVLSFLTLIFTYAVAIPFGIYSATHQYSATDYVLAVSGFTGLAIPNFLLALVLMFLFWKYFAFDPGGLFSIKHLVAPWSFAKVIDMIKHLPIPIIVIGTAGTAALQRIMRACLLDELQKAYVITARAKGLKERTLLFKYPVRVAVNPIVSTVGWILPEIFSGAVITAIVLSLPTVGPLLYTSLISQDVYLSGSIIMILSLLTLIGTLLSDILLVWLDPRIRYEKKA